MTRKELNQFKNKSFLLKDTRLPPWMIFGYIKYLKYPHGYTVEGLPMTQITFDKDKLRMMIYFEDKTLKKIMKVETDFEPYMSVTDDQLIELTSSAGRRRNNRILIEAIFVN